MSEVFIAVDVACTRIFAMLMFLAWIYGVVLAKGIVSTLVAIFFPFWSWYLVVEKAAQGLGWL